MATASGTAHTDERTGLTARRMARTRRELAEAAARMFKEDGYEATTVEGICAHVEVSPRTFFRYFASKEDVIEELLESHLDEFVQALAERPNGEAVLDSLLAAATGGYGDAEAREQDFLELFQVVHRTPALRARWLDRGHRIQAELAEVLGGRLAGGELATRLVAGALVGTLTAVIESWAEAPGEAPLRALVVEALQLLAGGFGLSEPAGGGPGERRTGPA